MLKNNVDHVYSWIGGIDNHLLFHTLEFFNNSKRTHISYEDVRKEVEHLKKRVKLTPSNIPKIISDYDVSVEMDDNQQMAELYHSLYVNDQLSKKIIIYSEWIQPLKIAELDLDLSKEAIYYMHLAHECFHVLEDCGLVPVVGKNNKNLEKARSEVGAHIFVTEYLNLPIHPRLVGYLIAIEKGWLSSNEFVIMMEQNISKLTEKSVAINDFFIR
ncbi:hypothetical protein [Virgibacillus pantothenticus]|uniref:hypothetical protein n=1 Tax=Virgibacillus pantothenticus TaxID=1473 RepID=UPI0009851EAB|nr:hypothetical protein [Virgibacillus pantothenticus]MBU8567091.1 hypothetical protein [Virgibacillus pantothenticus]MBU8600877.1 hypothetical protein [Virgibacillus pantothenticus]MBU8635243.1 hypothetical protein [Virgibacillus pantothenticus]MBU8642942.1 hypothetical protein [Virgibacillus pantothenticus]MBU8647037.1 hypothetical protein [Virgibacillus pantothenticus]